MLKKHIHIIFCIALFSITSAFSQEEGLILKAKDTIITNSNEFNPLAPSKAAFYSAVLPGLGQAYNKKYWKIPLVYAALGSGVYFYSANNKNYKRVRDAYKLRINDKPDEFNGENGNPFLSKDALISAQKSYKKNKDLSLLITAGLYILQIVEASTNAHLLQHNVDNNLSITPKLIQDTTNNRTLVGASFNFKF